MDGTGKQPRWPMVKLGDVCEIIRDQARLHANTEYELWSIPSYDNNAPEYLIGSQIKSAKFVTKTDDILLSKINPRINRVWMVKDTSSTIMKVCSTEWIVLRIKNQYLGSIIHDWLLHFLKSPNFRSWINSEVSGSTGSHTRAKPLEVLQQSLPLPPLAEQQRIVARLDAAFAAIDEASAAAASNARNARALFESYLDQVFNQRGAGWVERRLGEVASTSLGKMLDKMKNMGELQPYLRNINVRWFYFDLFDVSQMPFLQHELQRYAVKKGDVLVCEGGYPGRAAIWDYDEEIYFQKALHRVRFHDVSLNEWFVYYLWLLSSTGSLSKLFTGTGIQHLTGVTLSKLIIPIPPRAESAELISKIKQMHSQTTQLTTIYERKVAALAELKQSLLAEVFGS